MSKKIEICAIIPARSGSKQIKDKNIVKVDGKPSLYFSMKASFKSKLISKVLFSSDSKKYLNIAKKYKPNFLHLRSKKNSKSNSTDLDFLKEIYHYLVDEFNYRPDVFALLRANNPTKSLRDINGAINVFSKNFKKYSSLRSVNVMSETSYKIDNLNLPKEKFGNTYSGNGCIDLIKTNNITNGILHGNKCYAYVTKDICVDIDYKNDIEYAKFILKNNKEYYVK